MQTQEIQYDSCNATAGSGVFEYNGICFPNNPIMLTLTENSQYLRNTVNFDNNQAYFLTSGLIFALSHIGTSKLCTCI